MLAEAGDLPFSAAVGAFLTGVVFAPLFPAGSEEVFELTLSLEMAAVSSSATSSSDELGEGARNSGFLGEVCLLEEADSV